MISRLHYDYDDLGRVVVASLRDASGAENYSAGYQFDFLGRFSSVLALHSLGDGGSNSSYPSASYYYDANANVGQLIGANGSIAANYEYDPYGNLIRATGPEADNNVFCFSAKYLDQETGLYYYGLRFYSPTV